MLFCCTPLSLRRIHTVSYKCIAGHERAAAPCSAHTTACCNTCCQYPHPRGKGGRGLLPALPDDLPSRLYQVIRWTGASAFPFVRLFNRSGGRGVCVCVCLCVWTFQQTNILAADCCQQAMRCTGAASSAPLLGWVATAITAAAICRNPASAHTPPSPACYQIPTHTHHTLCLTSVC